jgi:7-keto-8-aminopelargonate synthetase-like enzyme
MSVSTSLQNSLRHRTAVKQFFPGTEAEAHEIKKRLEAEGFDVRITQNNDGTRQKPRMVFTVRVYERKK